MRRMLILMVACFLSVASFGQVRPSSALVHKITHAKRIGLVLGGGGVRGLAHVGVIQALEEYGIKPTVIGGTSMGAIVGSVYAMGYSTAELDSVFLSIDYNDIFFRSYKKQYPSIFLKEFESNSLVRVNMKKFKPNIPTFYSTSLPMVHLYNGLMMNKNKYDDFSQLDKEFYCTGTDIYGRKTTIFDQGEVIRSVMASSAYPFVFAPQNRGDSYYIDGGVFDNFPIDGMKNRNVDAIIGVDVRDLSEADHKTKPKSVHLGNIVDALFGSFEDTMMNSKIKWCDLYIHPKVDGVSSLDFAVPKRMVQLGYEKMVYLLDSLGFKRVISKEKSIRAKGGRKKYSIISGTSFNSENIPLGKVNYFFSDSISDVYRRQILSYFPIRDHKKNMYSLAGVSRSIEDIYNTGIYQIISYRFDKNKPSDTTYSLDVSVVPKNIDYELLASASYTNQFGTEFMLGVLTRKFLVHNSYLSFQFMFGSAPRYNLNYYLDRGLIPSIGFSSQYYFYTFINKFDEEVLNYDNGQGLYPAFGQFNFRNKLYLKSNIKKILGLETGVEYNLITQRQTSVFSVTDNNYLYRKVGQFNLYAQLIYDRLNDKLFPQSGLLFRGEFKILDLQTKVEKYAYNINVDGIGAFPLSKKLSLLARIKLANIFNFEGSVSTINFFKLGGAFDYNIYNSSSLAGYDQVTSIFTKGYAYAAAGLNYQPVKKLHVMFNLNVANVMLRQSSLLEDFDKFKYVVKGVSLMVGYDSSLTPFVVGGQYSPEQGFSLVFRLGYVY